MRHRLVITAVTSLVVAAHGLVIFSPMDWSAQPPAEALAPAQLHAIWVQPPVAAPPAPPPPAAATPLRPPHTAAPRALPRPVKPQPAAPSLSPSPSPAEAPPASAAPAVLTSEAATAAWAVASPAVPALASAPVQVAEAAPEAPPPPAFPRMQVHDAHGAPLEVAVPVDATEPHQEMLLRFKVQGWVKGMQYHAQAELAWQTEGDRYQARQSISAFLLGSMEQTSSGHLTAQGLQPVDFTDRRFAKRRSVHLDWPAQQATFDPARETVPIGPGTQDRLSVFLQLAALLQAMPDLRSPGTRIDIPTLGSRRLQMWTFVVEQEETLDLPAGSLATLRLQRLPQAGDTEKAQLWLNPAQGYVPARIHIEEGNGDVMDLSLK